MRTIDELVEELSRLVAADRRPFPSDACEKLLEGSNPRYHGLIPDLDYYFSELAGYRSHGRRVLNWSEDKIRSVRASLSRSFVDRHPIYVDLMRRAADKEYSDLSYAWRLAEEARRVLDTLLTAVQTSRVTVR